MVNSAQDKVSPDKSEQKAMEGSNSAPDKSELKTKADSSGKIDAPISLKLPQKENGDSQNGEIVSSEDKQSQSSAFSNELAIIESRGSFTCIGGIPSSTPETVPDQQSGQITNLTTPPSKYPDKALEDGYNWRKYGQKFVKGNEFVRSYYRCTHPSCKVKRQVERSHDGHITDTVYIGNHTHFEARVGSHASVYNVLPIQSIETEGSPTVTEKNKSSDAHGPAPTSHEAKSMSSPHLPSTPMKNVLDVSNSKPEKTKLTSNEINDGDPPLKRQKRDGCDIDETPVEKPYGEPRFVGEPRVVQTMSEVDVLQDGYRWRKYGQKLVKGNPNPRSYYRCSSSGCPAKKHVERAALDAKAVITTYEGQHDHDMPPARTVTHNRRGAMPNMPPGEDNTTSKPEGKITDMVVHVSAN